MNGVHDRLLIIRGSELSSNELVFLPQVQIVGVYDVQTRRIGEDIYEDSERSHLRR